MTREEEILNAARERAGRHQIAERELNKYSSQLYDGIYSSEISSFEAGAKWADENPKNVWHDSSEYPAKAGTILYQTTLGQFRTVFNDKSGEGAWKVFAIDYEVSRWAYIDELIK